MNSCGSKPLVLRPKNTDIVPKMIIVSFHTWRVCLIRFLLILVSIRIVKGGLTWQHALYFEIFSAVDILMLIFY